MARTKVFISSTFYDLKHIRGDLENFLNTMCYDPILHEIGKIPYKKDKLENDCYREINNADIVICIIGSKYGSESVHGGSITQNELKKALESNKKLYIFVEERVLTEFSTWRMNKENKEIKYSYVDDSKIYEFLESIYNLPNNNQIKEFNKNTDITEYLKEQWSGLFHEYLNEEVKKEEVSLAKELKEQINNFSTIVEFLREDNKKVSKTLEEFIYFNNKFLEELLKILIIPKTFYIKKLGDLKAIMNATSYEEIEEDIFNDYYSWTKNKNNKEYKLMISTSLFNEQEYLRKDINDFFDKRKHFIYERKEIQEDDEEFPF